MSERAPQYEQLFDTETSGRDLERQASRYVNEALGRYREAVSSQTGQTPESVAGPVLLASGPDAPGTRTFEIEARSESENTLIIRRRDFPGHSGEVRATLDFTWGSLQGFRAKGYPRLKNPSKRALLELVVDELPRATPVL